MPPGACPHRAPLPAEVAIGAFPHVGWEIRTNPAALPVDNALLLKFMYSRPAALDGGRVMRIFGRLPMLGFRNRYRLHSHHFTGTGTGRQCRSSNRPATIGLCRWLDRVAHRCLSPRARS